LNYLFTLVDENEDRKRTLRAKIKQGIAAAETLKRRTTISATTISTLSDHSTDLNLQNDRELSEAYQHCLNGNHLVNVHFSFNYFSLIFSLDEHVKICTS